MNMTNDEGWMKRALQQARRAYSEREVPVGAVVVKDGCIIGRGYNQREQLNDPTAHAEMLAVSSAANTLQSWRLDGCSLYVTLEPCAMCAGALVLARVQQCVIAAPDPKAGACGSLRNILRDERLNHLVEVRQGVLEEESALLLKQFFRELRQTRNI